MVPSWEAEEREVGAVVVAYDSGFLV